MNLIDVEIQTRDLPILASKIESGIATPDDVYRHDQMVLLRQQYERNMHRTTWALWLSVGAAWIGAIAWMVVFRGWEESTSVALIGGVIVCALIAILHD